MGYGRLAGRADNLVDPEITNQYVSLQNKNLLS
jgi:hypothetical protein